jgi:hypothetical protein
MHYGTAASVLQCAGAGGDFRFWHCQLPKMGGGKLPISSLGLHFSHKKCRFGLAVIYILLNLLR